LCRYIVSSICHEFDNMSLMVSESVMYSASMIDNALDCILGVAFFPLLNWGHFLKHGLHLPVFHTFMSWLPAVLLIVCYGRKEFDCCSFYCYSICLFTMSTIGWFPFLT
jgi:hypothetical protein